MIELNKIYNEDCIETMKRIENCFIDLSYYFAMKTLLLGMLNENKIHFANVDLVN